MAMTAGVQIKAVAQPIDLTVGLLRRALQNCGLEVTVQLNLSRNLGQQLTAGNQVCVLLMVDRPLLLFESVALERSAAALIPIHLVLTGDQHSTCIHWAHPATSLGFRMPSGIQDGVETLFNRVNEVLGAADEWAALSAPTDRSVIDGR